jgi:DNA polymerase
MAEPSWLSSEELAEQLRKHLDSLQRAGVEWIPNGPLPLPVPAAAKPKVESEPVYQSSLFSEVSHPTSPSSGEGDTPEQRRHELTLLAERVAACTRCAGLAATRTQTVFGVGPVDPELCFIGEAPGANEDLQGEPFVGEAGQLLNRIINACGMKREDVYICNIIRCRPPGNRLPQAEEAANCREYLEKQLELVRPKFICTLGACAAQNLLGTKLGIGKLRGRFHDFKGIPVMCTFHPAFLLPGRSPERKKDVWEDMKKLLARMGRPIPGK